MVKRWHILGLLMLVGALFTGVGTVWAFSTGFEEFGLGTTSESITLPGVTLASPYASGDWTVQDNTGDYIALSGHILKNNTCAPSSPALMMAFDSLQVGLSFLYGADPSVDVVKVDGWLGVPGPGTLQFSHSYYGSDLGSPTGKLEGSVNFTGPEFDHIMLYSPGGCLAIDDVGPPILPAGAPGPDMVPLPEYAAVGTFVETTPAYFLPDYAALSDVVFEAGKSTWVLGVDETGEFYNVVFSGIYLWVPVNTIGPNYDAVWGGHPLPTELAE